MFTGPRGAFVYVTMRFALLPVVSVLLLVWIPVVAWILRGDEREDQIVWCVVLFLEAGGFLIASRAFPEPWIPRLG